MTEPWEAVLLLVKGLNRLLRLGHDAVEPQARGQSIRDLGIAVQRLKLLWHRSP